MTASHGAPAGACRPGALPSIAVTSAEPAPFRAAVDAMNSVTARPEIELGTIRPPQRLAPFSYALGAEIKHRDTDNVPEQSEGDAFGRLILLHDPDGDEAWNGTMRLVAYIQADLDASEAVDPLLPEVAWSWLVDAINSRTADVTALGGTVTATTSVRYGDIADRDVPTSWSYARPGPRPAPISVPTSRRSVKYWSMRRACRRWV